MKELIIFVCSLFFAQAILAQNCYWQQKSDYKMKVDFDVTDHTYEGHQIIIYTNNSPDTLNRLFYHLYFNAFQPNSMMDERNLQLPDADRRVGDRIHNLTPTEIGNEKVHSLKMNEHNLEFTTQGTILEVKLKEPILPGQMVKLEMEYTAQVPVQIRRSGRDNSEGIDYSMAQWYPKLCEYDSEGWHADPYVGREFYGIWGDFDIEINIPANYVVAAGGTLKNKEEVEKNRKNNRKNTLVSWHFRADNVHDFVWAADRDYTIVEHEAYNGTMLRFVYQPGEQTNDSWSELPRIMDEALKFINTHYGKYPYPSYSFIQGGDGGMEYPMATLITGNRPLNSLVGVSVHEWMHSWYQMMMGTNESLYPWMDEGFTSYASAEVMNYLIDKKLISGEYMANPHEETVLGMSRFNSTGRSEPLSMHADHYTTNAAYGVGSYVKGEVFLTMLNYIVGNKIFDQAMLRYYNEWRFKHPNANDFIRIMEKSSNLELDWYKEYMVNTTQLPDYGIDTIFNKKVILSKVQGFPMPIELVVFTKKGKKICYYIPITLMRGEKEEFDTMYDQVHVESDWPWTRLSYELAINEKMEDIERIVIDPSFRLCDANYDNNVWPRMTHEIEILEENKN
ncbi:MAG TPA: M1 family metallopeptidase [Saprospiraceae bacterium]|nr:M1 family metallopeptidase [Saprospiraceae bacterium]MCB9328504.1 M1 family metallopeptidase [Lewinellaceae bacterium]HPK10636.1 M1 family metallopeptidase [Saprospiraceae bacterium]HPQ20789.1 M1 family metallopeptidase [Saprospiraceae bacterium]